MRKTITSGFIAGTVLLVAGLGAGPALAGPDDINPVFAALPAIPEAELDGASGKGDVDMDATVSGGILTINPLCTTTCTPVAGTNTIDGSAFSGSTVFAAITQNTGSFVSVQNLLVVEVDIID